MNLEIPPQRPADQLLSSWADAHVFYNLYDHPSGLRSAHFEEDELEWRKRLLQETPNGSLIRDNSMFEVLRSDTISLLHVTTEKKLKGLLKETALYPSGGCLVGSIYCSLLRPENGDRTQFHVHNLGRYIFEAEAPRAISGEANNAVTPIIAEAAAPKNARDNLIGLDYLRLGDIHLNIYRSLEYLMRPDERQRLEDDVIYQIKASVEFLGACQAYLLQPRRMKPEEFLAVAAHAIERLPIIGYFLCETVIEFLLCHQNCDEARASHEQREFYNRSYKELLFTMRPNLVKSFNLATFNPSPVDLSTYIALKSDWGFTMPQMFEFMAERLAFLVCSRLIPDATGIDWRKIAWRFFSVTEIFGPLVGHLIHRQLRTFQRSGLFYFYYDQTKAMQVWNYWNHNDIAVSFNGVIPKGEVGINPAYPLDWKFYRGMYRDGLVCKDVQLSLKAVPRLVDLKNTFMRSKQ